ncbi:MAG: transglycosylase SLT domain-containing protein, partial [Gallionella sp.]
MSLIRQIFSVLIAVSAVALPSLAHASEELVAGHPDEILALNSPLTNTAEPANEPEFLPSARDIRIELLPLAPAIQETQEASKSGPAKSDLTNSDPAARDLWARIRNGFSLHEVNSKLVAKHEKWYANHPDYVDRMTERARRYLFYITEEVERRGMPAEIALLPMVESAFNPGAYSVSRASGIWQFIPSTGRKFGMEQNWWYDGRRDVINATSGALDYLQKLHDMFGNWELALAAYNCGEGAVQRAQAHNRKRG